MLSLGLTFAATSYDRLIAPAKVSSRCIHSFPAAILVEHGAPPTQLLHIELCKFAQNISTNISSLGKRRDLGEVSPLLISYNITIFGLYPLDSIRFIFSLRDSEKDLLE